MITLLLSLLLALAQQASAAENSSTSRGPSSTPPASPPLAFLPDVAERDVARLSPTVSASAAATLFPPHRVSTQTLVELWVAVADAGVCGDYKRAGSGAPQCVASVTATGPSPSGGAPLTTTTNWTFSPSATATPWARLKVAALNVSQWHGRIQIEVTVAAAATTGVAVAEPLLVQRWQYEVINTSTASTRLIDGAFIDIVHCPAPKGSRSMKRCGR